MPAEALAKAGGDFKPNLEPLTKGLVKSGMNIQEYLEQENEKPVESALFKPSESWWNWLKKSLTATQCWIGTHIWQTKEIIGVFEAVEVISNETPEIP